MNILNIAINFFSQNRQSVDLSVPVEDYIAQVERFSALLDRFHLTEDQAKSAISELSEARLSISILTLIVSNFFESILSTSVPEEEFGSTFIAIVTAWRDAGIRIDNLGQSLSYDVHLTKLRNLAAEAYRSGAFDETNKYLGEIDASEAAAEREIKIKEHQLASQHNSIRSSRTLTKKAQYAVALSQLHFEEAASFLEEEAELTFTDHSSVFATLHASCTEALDSGYYGGMNSGLKLAVAIARKLAARSNILQQRSTSINMLGVALTSLGKTYGHTDLIEEAIQSMKYLLTELLQEQLPADWAETQGHLASALKVLAELRADPQIYGEAIAAFTSALRVYTIETMPQDWARTQVALGNCYRGLGELQRSPAILWQGVESLRSSLHVISADQDLVHWAVVQNSLGFTLRVIGDLTCNEGDVLSTARDHCQKAASAFLRDITPQYWAMAQNNLANALKSLGVLQYSVSLLHESATYHRLAREVYCKEEYPMDWAMVEFNLGHVSYFIGLLNSDVDGFVEAENMYESSLTVYKRENSPADWAMVNLSLANTHLHLAILSHGQAGFTRAIAHYQSAASVYTEASSFEASEYINKQIKWCRTQICVEHSSWNEEDTAAACIEGWKLIFVGGVYRIDNDPSQHLLQDRQQASRCVLTSAFDGSALAAKAFSLYRRSMDIASAGDDSLV